LVVPAFIPAENYLNVIKAGTATCRPCFFPQDIPDTGSGFWRRVFVSRT
jgi:hypothetical protein